MMDRIRSTSVLTIVALSAGTGPSTNQGFAFLAPEAPSPGDMPIGEFGGEIAQTTSRYNEGGMRNLFRANSGILRVTESTARRVVGEFELEATLLYVCGITLTSPRARLMEAGPPKSQHFTGSPTATVCPLLPIVVPCSSASTP